MPHSVFVCGDDSEAKQTVTALLTALGHRDVIDLGDLSAARGTVEGALDLLAHGVGIRRWPTGW